jgi:hypothetical protein
MEHMLDVLLTFTGFHDPYFKGLVDQEEQIKELCIFDGGTSV